MSKKVRGGRKTPGQEKKKGENGGSRSLGREKGI